MHRRRRKSFLPIPSLSGWSLWPRLCRSGQTRLLIREMARLPLDLRGPLLWLGLGVLLRRRLLLVELSLRLRRGHVLLLWRLLLLRINGLVVYLWTALDGKGLGWFVVVVEVRRLLSLYRWRAERLGRV